MHSMVKSASLNPIVVEIQGGLGNQLFQLCAALVAAKRTNRSFVLDVERLRWPLRLGRQRRSFELSELVDESEVSTRYHALSRRLLSPQRLVERERGHGDDVLGRTSRRTSRIVGYFQSYSVVEEASELLFQRISKSNHLNSLVADHKRDSISVHVRCGDYLKARSQRFHGLTNPTYFRDAITSAVDATGIRHVCVVSDDLGFAEKLIRTIDIEHQVDISHFAGQTAWEDLSVLANSGAVVMSNSSFSWWGGYLAGRRHNAFVVAPIPWYAYPSSAERVMLPHMWKRLERSICSLNTRNDFLG